MDSKTASLIQNLKNNKVLAEQVMHSGEGQRLLTLLSQSDGGQALRDASEAAAQGNPQALTAMLTQMMGSPEARSLMEKLSEQVKK